jgi:hypothetical protein
MTGRNIRSSWDKEHASNAGHRARDVAVAMILFWRRLFHEAMDIVIATTHFAVRLLRYGYDFSQTPILRRIYRKDQLALDRRLSEIGLGAAAMRERIATLEDRIRSLEAVKLSSRTSKFEQYCS